MRYLCYFRSYFMQLIIVALFLLTANSQVSSLYAQSITLFINDVIQANTYTTIDAAVTAIEQIHYIPSNLTFKIVVPPGIYEESVLVESLSKPLTITSFYNENDINSLHYIDETIINGNDICSPVSVINCNKVTLNGLTMSNGNGIWNTFEATAHLLMNSTTGNYYMESPQIITSPGGGILIKGSNCNINSCMISNNTAANGGGVFAYASDVTILKTTIKENRVISCNNQWGEALYALASNIKLIKSKVSNNGNENISNSSCGVISYRSFDERYGYSYRFDRTLISDNYAFHNILFMDNTNMGMSNISNCTIVNNLSSSQFPMLFTSPSVDVGSSDCTLSNNIIRDNMTVVSPDFYPLNQIKCVYNARLFVDYNNIYNLNSLYSYPMQVLGENNTDVDPLFLDSSQQDYRLVWNTVNKSPCIDAGKASNREALYSVPDIGAFEFDEFENHCAEYTFPANNQSSLIKWMSFPVLYDVQNGHFTNQMVAGTMFSDILFPDILNKIEWNGVYDFYNDISKIDFRNGAWQHTDSLVTSQQGYRLEMSADNAEERTIKVSGFLQDKTTPIPIYGPQNGDSVENWVGYFYPATVNVFDALAEIIDNLYYIKTQYWTLVREEPFSENHWLGRALPGHSQPTLSPGDMAIVKSFQDVELIWNNAPEEPRYDPPKTEHYAYVEKIDYIPIYVDFKGGNVELPKEIAIYINGVCKGAAVVTDSLAQICAYICDDLPDNPEVEFMLFYDAKNQGVIPSYKVWNPVTHNFQNSKLIVCEKKDYFKVKITKTSVDNTPLPRLSLSNYPNPFNPETSIKYYVPTDAKIQLCIYNTKGQLVKTLINEKKYAGMQETNWNGTDSQGIACASGVYFCKMLYGSKTISKKLILMK